MARPRKNVVLQSPLERETPPQLIEGEALPDELALERLLTELDSSETTAKVSIWRANRVNKMGVKQKDEFLQTMAPADFSQYGLEGVQGDYGEGDYRVRIFDPSGDMLHNRIHSVGPLSQQRKRELEAENRAAVIQLATPPAPQQDNALVQMLGQILSSQREGFNQLAAILAAQGNNRQAMLQEMQMMKTLFSNGDRVPVAPSDPLAPILGAITLLKDLGVGKTAETNTLDVFLKLAEEFAPAITEIAKAQANKVLPSQPMPQPMPQPQPQPEQPALAAPQSEQPETMDQLTLALRQFLPMLIAQANQNNGPEKYADMILDHVPAETVQAFVARPDWFEFLASINGNVQTFRPWFEELRQCLVDFLTEDQNQRTSVENSSTDGISTHGEASE